jgi:transcriptional regulator with XRE-family HTH domain
VNEQDFGTKLRELRIRARKSQTEVANEISASFPNRVRMSQTTLSALEQREDAPREEILIILAEYYDIPITYFLNERHFTSDQNRGGIELAKIYIQSLPNRTFLEEKTVAHSYPAEDEDF